jgi:hypothetical protein
MPEIEWIEPVQLNRILYDLQNLRHAEPKQICRIPPLLFDQVER